MTSNDATFGPSSPSGTFDRSALLHLAGPGEVTTAAETLTVAGYQIADRGRWLGSDAVIVQPGWDDSPGVGADLAVARVFGVPVFEYVAREDDFDLLRFDAVDQFAILTD